MRMTAFFIACGALALLTTQAVAQDRDWDRRDHRYEQRGDRYDRRDDRRDRWGGGGIVLFEHRDFYGDARPIRRASASMTAPPPCALREGRGSSANTPISRGAAGSTTMMSGCCPIGRTTASAPSAGSDKTSARLRRAEPLKLGAAHG